MAGEEYGRPTEKDGSGADAGGLRRLGQEEPIARSPADARRTRSGWRRGLISFIPPDTMKVSSNRGG